MIFLVIVNPRSRQRTDVVSVRAGLSKQLSNAELLAAFARSMQGKLQATHTLPRYVAIVRDALAYVRGPDGSEVPVHAWRKETIWEYIHFVEANYCRHLAVISLPSVKGVACRKKVWTGTMDADVATQEHCAGCKIFATAEAAAGARLNALNKFFKFLARAGVIETNFVRDVVSEYSEDVRQEGRREKRRNPSVEEMVKLVNGTGHPRNRAFYAASAKWWFRPNEMIMLDRYASFPNFEKGADLVLLPDTKGRLDKRKGNRVSVIDSELRPILEQYFVWWERNVARGLDGKPQHTCMWITEHGNPVRLDQDFYRYFFYRDCERLGLMQPGDREDPLKRWTAHCQRHFGEKLLMMNNCPDTWAKHFRGDAVKDARGHYFVPTAEQIRAKYHEWVPLLGFLPMAELSDVAVSTLVDEREVHRLVFQKGIDRAREWHAYNEPFRCGRIVEVDESGREVREIAVVPKRYVPSFLFAARIAHPTARIESRADTVTTSYGRNIPKTEMIALCERGQEMLKGPRPQATDEGGRPRQLESPGSARSPRNPPSLSLELKEGPR